MLQIPSAVLARFETCLDEQNIPKEVRIYYKKWLRFYLDFCSKYQFDSKGQESLVGFLKKLSDKGQAKFQQEQAAHSVRLFLGFDQQSTRKNSSEALLGPSFQHRENFPTPSA